MKSFIVLFVALAMMLCLAHSQPVPDEEQSLAPTPLVLPKEGPLNATDLENTHIRQKRATCDLLSKFNVNHSVCAAHCLAKRYKGGYCNSKAVCVCRH